MSPSVGMNWIWREWQALWASWLAMFRERFDDIARNGYLLIWALRPIFDLAIAALIYAGGRRDLIPYVVVSLIANAAIWSAIFWVGEVLDRERMRGTLVSLFLTPCSRLSWLIGFAGAGMGEMLAAMLMVGLAGVLLFGVRFDPNPLALAVVAPLYLLAVGGLGLALSGVGLLLKKANQLANLVFPLITLLGGIYYPVAALPDPLRYLARALPFGYGMEALAGASLRHAALSDMTASVVPLALFALVYPLLGAAVFSWIGRLLRERGEVDLY